MQSDTRILLIRHLKYQGRLLSDKAGQACEALLALVNEFPFQLLQYGHPGMAQDN